MFAPTSGKARCAAVLALGLVCLAIVLVVDNAPSMDVSKEADQGDADWLPKSDPVGQFIDHEDDQEVREKAKEADRKFGAFSRRALKSNWKTVDTDSVEVDTAMKKAVREERKDKERTKRDNIATQQAIREIYDQTYHLKMVAERRAKKMKEIRAKRKAKLIHLRRVQRVEVQFKKDCKVLANIMSSAQPKERATYADTVRRCKTMKA